MKTDESAMTGETNEIKKHAEKAPLLLSGTTVNAGVGIMMVTAVGECSEWGMAMAHINEEPDPTPLQNKLEDVAALIGRLGMSVAILTFLVLLISWVVPVAQRIQGGTPFNLSELSHVVDFLIIGVTIVVVAVPEGASCPALPPPRARGR
jgi:magnesium-transporting ATPase (P-type)